MAKFLNRITAAWNMLVSSSPGLQEYAGSTVRPSESSNRFGQRYKATAQELVNGFTKYVAVAQTRNANAVASCPLRLYRQVRGGRKTSWDMRPVKRKELLRQRSRSGAWTRKAAEMSDEVEEIVDPLHPVLALLNKPNLLLGGYGLIEQIQLGIGLTGDNYLHPVGGPDGYPVEAWLLPPQFMIPLPNRDTIIGGYIYGRGTEVEKEYPASDVIRFTQPNPKGDPFRGFGDLEKCILDAELSLRFSQIRLQMIDNGAQPGLVLVAKGASEEQRARIEALVNRKFSGGQNQGRTMVLSGDIAVNPWSMTEKEVKFLDSDPQVRETIANCHDMSSALLTLDSAALATAEAAIPQWQEQAIKPRCNRIADTLNIRLMPMFGELSGADTLYLCFDEAVEKDANADGALAVSMYAGDIITKNEARELADYDAVPDGDQFSSEVSQANAMETLAATPTPTLPGGQNSGDSNANPVDPNKGEQANPKEPTPKEFAVHPTSLTRKAGEWEFIALTEAEFEGALLSWFEGIATDLTSHLTDKGLAEDSPKALAATLRPVVRQPLGGAFVKGWNFGVTELGTDAGDAKYVAGLTGPVEKYLREYEGKLVKSVTATVDEKIRNALADGVVAGESIPQLQTRLQTAVVGMKSNQAEMIARTETARAFMTSREKSWAESGNVWGKRWLLAPDACAQCLQIAKEYGVQPLGKDFLSKGETMEVDGGPAFVSDYSATSNPPLHPRCRCSLVMVMEEPKQ